MKIYPHYSHEGFVNSYLVGNEVSREALIIDPGKITDEVIGHIEKNGYTLSGVCITHNHIRHYGYGLPTLLKIYNPRIYAADQALVGKHGKMLRGDCTLSIAGFSVECFSVPGHSPADYHWSGAEVYPSVICLMRRLVNPFFSAYNATYGI